MRTTETTGHPAPTRARCLAVWAGALLAATVVVLWALPDLRDAGHHLLGADTARAQPFDRWLAWLAAAVLTGCALWASYVTSVVVLEALRGTTAPVRAGVPTWSRRLVLAACGAAVVAGIPTGAQASGPAPGTVSLERPDPRASLHGLPLPERAQSGSVTDLVGGLLLTSGSPGPATTAKPSPPAAPPPPDQDPGVRQHVVAPGESLWTIARSAVPARAGTAAVAAYWPRLHAANRAAVGPDPDLITPGQQLVLPPVPAPTPDHPREDHR